MKSNIDNCIYDARIVISEKSLRKIFFNSPKKLEFFLKPNVYFDTNWNIIAPKEELDFFIENSKVSMTADRRIVANNLLSITDCANLVLETGIPFSIKLSDGSLFKLTKEEVEKRICSKDWI